MARIRTIKPEFPQSESMGRISRDARLAFILMWPHCDDAGRLRASSRALASLLFPFDDDAPKHISGWLDELEKELCITRYEVDGSHYLQVENFLKHQKIDHPSKSNIPAPLESSRGLSEASRIVALDQGKDRTKERTKDISSLRSDIPAKRKSRRSLPEDFPLEFDRQWAETLWLKHGRADLCSLMDEESSKFRDHHSAKLTSSADWSASWRTWAQNAIKFSNGAHNGRAKPTRNENWLAGAGRLAERLRTERE